jgi:hypothetical protein
VALLALTASSRAVLPGVAGTLASADVGDDVHP